VELSPRQVYRLEKRVREKGMKPVTEAPRSKAAENLPMQGIVFCYDPLANPAASCGECARRAFSRKSRSGFLTRLPHDLRGHMIRLFGGKQRGVGNTHMRKTWSRLNRPYGIRLGRSPRPFGAPRGCGCCDRHDTPQRLCPRHHGHAFSKLYEKRIGALAIDAPERQDVAESPDRTGRISGH